MIRNRESVHIANIRLRIAKMGRDAQFEFARIFGGLFRLGNFQARSWLSKSRPDPTGPAVVTLTTHGQRVRTVHLTIESILRGSVKPREVHLWLDNAEIFEKLTPGLRRLKQRGIAISLTDNYGPHTKIFPYIQSKSHHQFPAVTADDDVLYPAEWLAELVTAYRKHPGSVSGFRGRRIVADGDKFAPYRTWPLNTDTGPSASILLTNVSGCIYPPRFLELVASYGDRFMDICPKQDDLWLHYLEVATGYLPRQVASEAKEFPLILNSQATSLMSVNLEGSGNDDQIAALYSPEVIDLVLRSE